EENEVGLRLEVVHVLHGLEASADEPVVHARRVEVRVRDVGERETGSALLRTPDVDELEAVRRDEPLSERDPRGDAGELQERPSRHSLQAGEERVPLLVLPRLDALHASTHRTSLASRARRKPRARWDA